MDSKTPDRATALPKLVDDLQARGRYSFTRAEVARHAGRTSLAIEASLRRLKRRGRVASPRRGFYVLVPVEYREAGCPPASWFIDDLMRFIGQPYYVGLLSAAAVHGAAHQQPMVFQVVTDRPTRPARAGRVRVVFHMSRHVKEVPAANVQTETGTMRVSSPEVTAFDLVRFPRAAGHLNNVATVLVELSEKIRADALAALAGSYAVPDVQRLGYLLERLGHARLAEPLHAWLQRRRYRPVLLAAGRPRRRRSPDARWRVVPNESVEADL